MEYPAADPTDKNTATLTIGFASTMYPWNSPPRAGNTPTRGPADPPRQTGMNFVGNDVYEFSYTAKEPTVAGLGFAAVRDWNSGCATRRRMTTARPTRWPTTSPVYTEISSQPGRRCSTTSGTSASTKTSGRKVFDGHAVDRAGSGIGMNYRFSQSGRTERNRQDHLYPENLFSVRQRAHDRSVYQEDR